MLPPCNLLNKRTWYIHKQGWIRVFLHCISTNLQQRQKWMYISLFLYIVFPGSNLLCVTHNPYVLNFIWLGWSTWVGEMREEKQNLLTLCQQNTEILPRLWQIVDNNTHALRFSVWKEKMFGNCLARINKLDIQRCAAFFNPLRNILGRNGTTVELQLMYGDGSCTVNRKSWI